jgi:FkbM family methyltransferase
MNELKTQTTIIPDSFLGQTSWCYDSISAGNQSYGTLVGAWEQMKLAIETHVPEPRVIITAGAHVGMYVYGYASMFKTVYAFEPDPLHFYCLVNNVQFPNVIKIQAGIGEIPAFGSMIGNSLGASLTEEVNTAPFIPILPLDSFQFPVVDMIQLDIEGYELRALKGAVHTIVQHKPLLMLENGHYENIVDFLTPLGYTIVERLHWDTIWKWGIHEPQV